MLLHMTLLLTIYILYLIHNQFMCLLFYVVTYDSIVDYLYTVSQTHSVHVSVCCVMLLHMTLLCYVVTYGINYCPVVLIIDHRYVFCVHLYDISGYVRTTRNVDTIILELE
jgi:hypothetical protein